MNDIEAHRTVVDRVTLRVPAGRFHAFPGPDGSRIGFTAAAFLAIPGIFDVIAHGQTGTSTSSGANIDMLDWMSVRDAEDTPAKNHRFVTDDGNIFHRDKLKGLAFGGGWEAFVRSKPSAQPTRIHRREKKEPVMVKEQPTEGTAPS
ncbi:hypothetical protein ACQP2U_33280 [Nocardia sp. CA-084685]|uniref:hypothetical protein n=1 Tax=Nocardia sp. CA-084685 TaxID=3239970 RepID=UPI003D95893D